MLVWLYLKRGADLHMAQKMPLPLTISCFIKIQIGFTFLVLAHPGSPGKRAVKRVCVCVCVSLSISCKCKYSEPLLHISLLQWFPMAYHHHHHHFICPIIQQYAHLHEYDSRRAGQQGPIRTLTAAQKRSIKTVTGCIFYNTNKNITNKKN